MTSGDVLSAPVLILNRSYQPVRVTTARQAFTMLFGGRARALDVDFEPRDFESWVALAPHPGEDAIGTPRGIVRIPRVLLLSQYNRVPRTPLRLSRRNIFLRDEYRCQYCGHGPPDVELNIDHVVPRSRGGQSSWENLVTSCRPCNLEKGDQTPEEAGMALSRRPARPTWSVVVQLAGFRRRFAQWEPFLGHLGDVPTAAAS